MTDLNNIEALSKEFCKLAGICWHEWKRSPDSTLRGRSICLKCDEVDYAYKNPDFANVKEVLLAIDRIGKLKEFVFWISEKLWKDDRIRIWIDYALLFVDDTGLMLKEAVEFLREEVK
jgi:hypothetical protein